MKHLLLLCVNLVVVLQAVWSQSAPVTTTGRITNATPGDPAVQVPITVTGFTDIAQFTLTMKFDTTRVLFVSAIPSASLPGMTVTYFNPSGNTFAKLIFSWTGTSNASLPDGSILSNLTFHYLTGTGNLTWAYTFGSVCQYKRLTGGLFTALADLPKYQYYENGGISNRSAPIATAPEIASPVTGPLSLPITVTGFTSIKTFTLYLEYNPAIITYLGNYTKNPAFDSNFIVGDNPGSEGKRRIVIQWFGSPVNLANGDNLCTLNFSYIAPDCDTSPLTWYDIGPTCQFSDNGGDVLIDMPAVIHYIDGEIGAGLAATWTGNNGNNWFDANNWNACGIPDQSKNAVIPNVSPLPYPVISDTVHCSSLEIQPGATLVITQTGVLIVGE